MSSIPLLSRAERSPHVLCSRNCWRWCGAGAQGACLRWLWLAYCRIGVCELLVGWPYARLLAQSRSCPWVCVALWGQSSGRCGLYPGFGWGSRVFSRPISGHWLFKRVSAMGIIDLEIPSCCKHSTLQESKESVGIISIQCAQQRNRWAFK